MSETPEERKARLAAEVAEVRRQLAEQAQQDDQSTVIVDGETHGIVGGVHYGTQRWTF
ncbi:hypothetical protein ACFWII_33860 [Streptomyces sp. NPDC127063]|uniref:hypothetical protein n=1 Tax=Streptomyces sp. NPDC127063 TaxID=3347123 RepID=UPI003652B909